jgi:uncharacterized membrane protein
MTERTSPFPKRLAQVLKHLWLDADDTQRAVPAALSDALARQVAQGEQQGGQIRLCVEASLPMSYLWRLLRCAPGAALARTRALSLFGKMGVWDTEHNSGVLVYVLLADHAIEIVADRGLRAIAPEQWQAVADALAGSFRAGTQAQGLVAALAQVQSLLAAAQLPREPVNELPDAPQLQ